MSIDYRDWFTTAKAELGTLREQKAVLERNLEAREREIAELTRTVNFLAQMLGEQPEPVDADSPPGGMTECIRDILRNATEPLTAAEIRESLEALGFDMKSYSNPLATIHTVLRRLGEANEVETTHEATPDKRKLRSVSIGKGLAVEKVFGKEFRIGGKKGFIGVGRLRRGPKNLDNAKENR
jgi:hypothetical protein